MRLDREIRSPGWLRKKERESQKAAMFDKQVPTLRKVDGCYECLLVIHLYQYFLAPSKDLCQLLPAINVRL
jgi:hypothetical protein